ncbi:MAG: cupin domain-containing protein [Candidatus Limnocylindrales bacterium]
MTNLRDIKDQPPIRVWEGVAARTIEGERITLAVVELDPDAIVPEHRHPNEQLGMVIRGELGFRIGREERVVGPGGTWRIAANEPHEVHVGPAGAEVIDIFSPIREDWHALPVEPARKPRWP